ncbi:MAG: potassium transporter TrkA [Candidatus Riflebacteria bacterium]|nr:potassium transporter TrkA [Candidatus Riflebacteria bacterium]
MQKFSLYKRLRYAFDNTMSKGPAALVVWLAIASLLLVLLTTAIVWRIDGGQMTLFEIFWNILFQAMTPNPVASNAGPSAFLIAMFVVTLGSLFMISILIGLLTTGIEGRLNELRKGRSFVVENGHTLILGWSAKVFTIISELVIANENKPEGVIVILADRDKVEMDDDIATKVPRKKNTRVVCRSGNPCDMDDLAVVNPGGAKSIIVLRNEEETTDHPVLKVLLALTNGSFRGERTFHIVTEVLDEASIDVVHMVGRDEVEVILPDDAISRIMVQTSRQSGLSVVYTELLNFDGDEIYFQPEPSLTGRTFGETLFAYEDSCVIGLARADGSVLINPPMKTVIASDDSIVAISRDDDTVIVNGRGVLSVDETAILPRAAHKPREIEHMLILSWNRKARRILGELNEYLMPGSSVHVVADMQGLDATVAGLRGIFKNLIINCVSADQTSREVLNCIDWNRYHNVIVLSPDTGSDIQGSDAKTIVTLLHLRDIEKKLKININIVSEMLDDQNRRLAEVTEADDFVVGDKLISLLLSQVSENKQLMKVFSDLFDVKGAEIYIKPAAEYVIPGHEIDFYTLLEAASRRGEVAIGYRYVRYVYDFNKNYGVVTNPPKSRRFSLAAEDRVIVIAEDL